MMLDINNTVCGIFIRIWRVYVPLNRFRNVKYKLTLLENIFCNWSVNKEYFLS